MSKYFNIINLTARNEKILIKIFFQIKQIRTNNQKLFNLKITMKYLFIS